MLCQESIDGNSCCISKASWDFLDLFLDAIVRRQKEMKLLELIHGSYKDVYEELGRLGCKVEVLEGCEWLRLTLEDKGPLKNSLKDGRGLDDLMDTQMTWMQRDCREIRVESRNASVLSLSYQILSDLVVGRYINKELWWKDHPKTLPTTLTLPIKKQMKVNRQLNTAFAESAYPTCSSPWRKPSKSKRGHQAAVSRHSGLLVPKNFLAQKKLKSKFWNQKMIGSDIDGYTARFHELGRLGAVSMANRLTIDGIKDGLFKKKENARNKRRSNDQNRNQGRRNYPRMNQATTSGGNRPNPMLAIKGNTNQGNNRNRAQGRVFGLGVAKSLQDPNVVMSTFYLNNHFATVLFVFSADYNFISTNFLSLINKKPSDISLGDEIEIASGVKRDFRSSWRTSQREPEIVEDHESERAKIEYIPIVHEFSGVFLEDLLGLPPSREVKFCIDFIPGAMHVAKLPYRLAPTEMQELANQLKELKEKDKVYCDLRGLYWWPGMKKEIAMYVSKFLTCSKVKAEHQKPLRLLQQPEIPEWKWKNISQRFLRLLQHPEIPDSIWVIVDRLTKSAHFLAVLKDFKTEKLKALGIRLDLSTAYHPKTDGQ
nr:hypothetical protein [Tanacetum cinerariifolium]